MKPIRPFRLSEFVRQGDRPDRDGFIMPVLGWVLANLYLLDGARLFGARDPARHALYVDCVIVLSFLFGALAYFAGAPWAMVFVVPRLFVVLLQSMVNGLMPSVKRRVRARVYTVYHGKPSTERSLVFGFLSYIELIVLFGAVYRAFPETARHGGGHLRGLWEPLYFSAITQLTIGYGDISPTSWGRGLAVGQTFFGLFVVVTQVARYVGVIASLPDPEDEEVEGSG